MNAPGPRRGGHLTSRRKSLSGVRLASLLSPAFSGLIARIDAGLAEGRIEGFLPDGSMRVLGGRAPGPVAEIRLKSWRALLRLAFGGSAGWYRAWEEREWDSPDPVPLFDLFMRNRRTLGKAGRARGLGRMLIRLGHALRRNSRAGSRRNIEYHYDLGNDFYAQWLDATMTYSSAIFAEPGEPLELAQARKIDALLDRLHLKDGDRLLEIGCGWGSLAEAALDRARIDYHGITLSPEQRRFALERLDGAENADVTLTDYRDVTGRYDAIASVEMVEAVGQNYWPDYLDAIARALKPGGRAAIQFISIAEDAFASYSANADFIQTYVFPGGMLLSEERFRRLAEARGLRWSDRTGFGLDYAETLLRWRRNFDAAVEQGRLPQGFDERFVRLWRYYLMYCEGGFRGRGIDVAQVTLIREE